MAYKWQVFLVVCVATLVTTMDFSGLSVALPVFGRIFAAPPEKVLWLTLAPSLAFTGFMLAAGRIGDIIGRKRAYLAGFCIFTVGLALSSVAQGFWPLTLYRVFQSLGGALLVSNGSALIAVTFPESERGRALGLQGSVVGAGLVSGPVLSGLLLDLLGWRAIFWVRVPLGLLGLLLTWAILKEAPRSGRRPNFDLGGALTLFGGLVCLMIVINQGHRVGWTAPALLALGGGAAALLALFLAIEVRIREPVIDLRLFRRRTFSVYNVVLLVYFAAFASVPLLLPFYLIDGRRYSPSEAGFFITAVPVLLFLVSPIAGTLSDRVGSWWMTTIGLALQMTGLFLISRLDADALALEALLSLAVLGVGAGLFETPTYSAVMGAVPSERLGTASALIATFRSIGHSTGQASAATIFAIRMASHGAVPSAATSANQALILAFQETVLALGSAAVLGFLIVLVFGRPVLTKRRSAAAQETPSL